MYTYIYIYIYVCIHIGCYVSLIVHSHKSQERRFRGHAFEPPAAAAPKELRDLARGN